MDKFLILTRRCRRLYLISALIGTGILFVLYHEKENASHIYTVYVSNEEKTPTIDPHVFKLKNSVFEAPTNSKTTLEFREKLQAHTSLQDLFRTTGNAISSTNNNIQSATTSSAANSSRHYKIDYNITMYIHSTTDSNYSTFPSNDINSYNFIFPSKDINSNNSTFPSKDINSKISTFPFKDINSYKSTFPSTNSNNSTFPSKDINSNKSTFSSKDIDGINMKSTTRVSIPETCKKYSMKESKLILLWTPFFGGWDYFPQENFQLCSHCRNCQITTDRSKLSESDGVIFHCRDISLFDLPSVRYPHQRWIFYCLKSPPYSDFPGLQYMRNMFNWTMTYRTDSDIVVRYGAIVKNQQTKQINLQPLQSYFAKKSKSVVWMTSHCPTFGGRDEYVAELRKYIDVDVYGTCGSSVCPPGDTEKCLQEYTDKYKFFLAFENTVCRDYITEKLFRNLKYDIIPVVFGGVDYDKFVPPNSYIDALSFQSPKHLALFLTEVGKDFKFYSNYFKWRENYSNGIINRKECDLCTMLHNKDLKTSSYSDLRKWWVIDSQCRAWEPKGLKLYSETR